MLSFRALSVLLVVGGGDNSVHNVDILNMAPLHTRRMILGNWLVLFSCILFLNMKVKVLLWWPSDFCVYQNHPLCWLQCALLSLCIACLVLWIGWDCFWEVSRWWWHYCLKNHTFENLWNKVIHGGFAAYLLCDNSIGGNICFLI